MPTIKASFETRREAELAVEHLVQEHELDREDIVVGPEGDDNSAGTEASGSDQETELEDEDDDDAALNGSISVTVTVESEELAEDVRDVLEEFGGGDASVDE